MKIVLGVTGSISIYKSVELVRMLVESQHEVKVVMTACAQKFITPLTFQTVGQGVYTSLFTDQNDQEPMPHIALAKWADVIVIAPTSAALMGKLANGIADDLLTALCIATEKPIYLAPSMNKHMWENLAVENNKRQLLQWGYHFLGPTEGMQACGDFGLGRMLEPEELVALLPLHKILDKKLKVLITAGPTQEALDPIRFISNKSSGKMGYALALAFAQLGAEVTLVSGPVSLTPPSVKNFIKVNNAEEMYHAVLNKIEEQEIVIAAAAVSDYQPVNLHREKIKKTAETWSLDLVKTKDILKTLGQLEKKPFLVGFAAETENLIENAQKKLVEKNLDLIAANLVTEEGPFFHEENELYLLGQGQSPLLLTKKSKSALALELANIIVNLYHHKSAIEIISN